MKSLSHRDLKLNSLTRINELKHSKKNHKINDIDLISPNTDKINNNSLKSTINKRSNSNNKINLKYENSNRNSQSTQLLSVDLKNIAISSSHSPSMTNKKRQFSRTSKEMTGDQVIVM